MKRTRIDKYQVMRLAAAKFGVREEQELAGLLGVHPNTVYNNLDSYSWSRKFLDSLVNLFDLDTADAILAVDEPVENLGKDEAPDGVESAREPEKELALA